MSALYTFVILASLTTADAGVESPDAAQNRREALGLCLKECASRVAEPTVEKKGPLLLECLARCEQATPAPARADQR